MRNRLSAAVFGTAVFVCIARFGGGATAATAVIDPLSLSAEHLPVPVQNVLRASGLPLKSFGLSMRQIDGLLPVVSLNDDQPFLLASTTKVVTSLAALQLLGPAHQWRTRAYATAPVVDGRTGGDLVIVGGSAGLTPAELGRWFKQMRGEGLAKVAGQIVLDDFSLLHAKHPAQAAATAAETTPAGPPNPRTYNLGKALVTVQPSNGERAVVTLQPKPPGVVIVNDVLMGSGCGARVRWGEAAGGAAQLLVSGRWDASCGRQEVAYVDLPKPPGAAAKATAATASGAAARAPDAATSAPAPRVAAVEVVSTPSLVASIWAQTGGRVDGGVVESDRPAAAPRGASWSTQVMSALPAVVREMNKTSNNIAAKSLLLSLAPAGSSAGGGLRSAQDRVNAWLRTQGLADGDIHIDEGSGESHAERGKPRAMVQLLDNAWHSQGRQEFIDSLPVAGVDGTLVNRMRKGPATGRAFLKTGTLSDTRALAGYVIAASGKVYAVALMVNHADASRGIPALDAMIEWLARQG